MTKEQRNKVFEKYGGRCAYCGCELGRKFQIDHIIPIFRNDTDEDFEKRNTHGQRKLGLVRGSEDLENLNPACPRCNGWKGTMSIETFRNEIAQQVERARKYSCNFRMAEDFKLVAVYKDKKVRFYFEDY